MRVPSALVQNRICCFSPFMRRRRCLQLPHYMLVTRSTSAPMCGVDTNNCRHMVFSPVLRSTHRDNDSGKVCCKPYRESRYSGNVDYRWHGAIDSEYTHRKCAGADGG